MEKWKEVTPHMQRGERTKIIWSFLETRLVREGLLLPPMLIILNLSLGKQEAKQVV